MSQASLMTGVLLMVLTTFIASTAAASSKYIGGLVSVEQIVCFQYGISLLFVLPVLAKPVQLQVAPADRIAMLLRAVSGLIAFYSYFLAIMSIPLVEATLLRNSSPLFIPFLGLVWLGTSFRFQHFVFLLLGMAGIIIILNPEVARISSGHVLGIVSALGVALSVVSTRKLSQRYSAPVILFYHYLLSFLGMLPFALLNWQPLSVDVLPWLLYIGVAVHLALYLYTRALGLACANAVAPVIYLGVVFSGLLDWLIWHHQPSLRTLAGILLVIVAGILATRSSSKNTA